VRARAADAGRVGSRGYRSRRRIAVEPGGAFLERVDHLAQRPVEHLAGEHLEHPVLEREVDGEVDQAAALPVAAERPVIVEVFERAIDIFDVQAGRARLGNARGEGLAQALEADDHVRDHLGVAVRADADRADPGQELRIARDIGDHVEHLLRRVGQRAGFGMLGHCFS